MANKPKVFIASPLFNPPQIEIIEKIEALLEKNGYEYYSARKHSGSDKMTPEQRKDLRAWDPVFDSNEQGLNECRVMIAVLEYALPEGEALTLSRMFAEPDDLYCEIRECVELPDAGTVWEAGYHRAQGKLVVGFHTDQAKHLNLMLSHGCDGLIKGWDNLKQFIEGETLNASLLPGNVKKRIETVMNRYRRAGLETNSRIMLDACDFDWEATEGWDAANKEVE